jgi:NitT/TauT family transport system substrate-binding protein
MIARIIGLIVFFFSGSWFFVPLISAQTLKVGITSKTLFFMPYYIGQKKGFYAAENLKVEPVLIGRSDVQLAALLAGELQIGSLNADATIVINEKGGNLKVIAGVDNSAPYILVGGKATKKVDDLKGAIIGVSALRGGATSILLDYLKSKGLLYPRDFTMVVISGGTI